MCVIASAVDLVFRLHRCMPDASRDISVKIYIVLFPIRPSAISPVLMSFTAMFNVNYSQTRKSRLGKISERMNRVVDAHIRTALEKIFLAKERHQ